MAILPGRRLGPYEILSAIGAGGMGEVYKASDTRLDRIVAIKVLPVHLADRAELRERFEREAKTIASLNHPHICTLYDTGHQDGIDFLVMEYLEGETLAQRLKKGPLPLDHVLRYAIEISDALDKAHRKGITHRDLKPGNIMLTKSGSKLLDFGLAKLRQDVAPATPFSELPTANDAATAQGTILGTLQYMAPEQVEGKTDEIDARTDIFAFGAVVYEMATGKKAFEGKSQASVMAKILEAEPIPMSSLQPMTPPALDHLVKRCLAKDPYDRWQSARDICEQLRWISDSGPQAGAAISASATKTNWRKKLTWAAIGLIVSVTVGLVVWNLKLTSAPAPQPVTRVTISLPEGQRLVISDSPTIAISPDGTRIAYVANQTGSAEQLYLRSIDSSEARPVPGTEGATSPFFSPDSQWLGFFVGVTLKKISVSGGAPVTLCTGPGVVYRGATWGSDDTITFQSSSSLGFFQVPAAGGTPKTLTMDLKKGDSTVLWPEFLPDGKTMLFAAAPSPNNVASTAHIAVRSLQTDLRQDLIAGTRPRYSPTGHLIYVQAGTLMAVPFDAQRLAVGGAPIPMLENVAESSTSGVAQYSFSNAGALIYLIGGVQGVQRKLVWVDRNGAEQAAPAPAHGYRTPRISPDGRHVAIAGVDADIWLYDLSRDTLTRLTFQGGSVPVWTPDGKHVTFSSSGGKGNTNIFWRAADGSGSAEPLTTFSEDQHNAGSWSPDGRVLSFEEVNPKTGRDVWIVSSSDRKTQPFLNTQFNETAPEFSPDGRWLAYASDESGRYEIYVQPYPGPGGKWQISSEGGAEPRWVRNGEIFYRNGDKMMAVETALKPSFSAGKPKILFEGRYVPTLATMPNYDVTPDGKRFLMVKPSEQDASVTQINVVLNWFEELKQKVPTGKK
jgi:eukaryotic-like serine/threonine-protein kinase